MDLREKNNRTKLSESVHPWELARLDAVDDFIGGQLNWSKIESVLDMGCGDTFFLESLAQRYPHISYIGIDINFEDAYLASKKANLPKNIRLFKSLEEAEAEAPNLKFNVVLLLDVIEHIENDVEFMSYMKSKPCFDASTSFCITVPAFQNLFCSHDVFLGHYRRYTNALLKSNLLAAGFQCSHLSYFFSVLIPPRILQVLKEKVVKPSKETTGLVEWTGSVALTSFIKQVLYFDYVVLQSLSRIGVKFPGLSNLALCRISA